MEPIVVRIKGNEGYQRLLGGPPNTMGLKSGCVTLEPGCSVGEHSTELKEEAIVILDGKAEVVLEGADAVTAEAESLVYIPPKTRHNVRNIGENLLRYVYIVSPVNAG